MGFLCQTSANWQIFPNVNEYHLAIPCHLLADALCMYGSAYFPLHFPDTGKRTEAGSRSFCKCIVAELNRNPQSPGTGLDSPPGPDLVPLSRAHPLSG